MKATAANALAESAQLTKSDQRVLKRVYRKIKIYAQQGYTSWEFSGVLSPAVQRDIELNGFKYSVNKKRESTISWRH